MKTLALLSFALLASCTCGDARLIDTYEPEPEPEQPPVDAGKPEPEAPDAGTPDAGQPLETPPDAGHPIDPSRCSPDGWCRDGLNPDGTPVTTRHLRAVFARGPNEAYAVGDYGTLLIFDGVSWRKATTGGPADDLFAVWASSPTDVWVAGIIGNPDVPEGMFAHFDGTAFDHIYKPLARRPEGLFGFGGNDVWAVGSGGEIRHFTGTSLNWYPNVGIGTEALTDVAGVNGRLWAVGANGTLLEQTATGWSAMTTPTPLPPVGGLAAIVAFGPSSLFAAGGNEWLQYDGTAWSLTRWPASADVELLGLWGASAQRLWGVGPSGKAWRFENGIATKSGTGVTELLRDLHGTDEQHVWAVGFNGMILRRYGP